MKRLRKTPEVNAGSMADIAFLLLIFFLVTTTILVDKGVKVILPPLADDPDAKRLYDEDFVLNISINANNEIRFEKSELDISQVSSQTRQFLKDRYHKRDRKNTVVALACDRSTKYATYIDVYDQLKSAYSGIWKDLAKENYNTAYDQLGRADQKRVRDMLPIIISESEPDAF